jgi:hypothetical protein
MGEPGRSVDRGGIVDLLRRTALRPGPRTPSPEQTLVEIEPWGGRTAFLSEAFAAEIRL